MRILLLAPPQRQGGDEYFLSSRENLALGYLAEVLRQNGYKTTIANFAVLSYTEDTLYDLIRNTNPKIIGISLTFWDERYYYLKFLEIVRSFAPLDAHINIGGYAPTLGKEFFSRNGSKFFNSITIGEGEETFLELISSIRCGKNWKTVKGLAYQENGSFFQNPPRPLIRNLDTIPFPARDDSDYLFSKNGKLKELYISSSRGCYARCSFCSIHSFYGESDGLKWRGRSPSNIVDELEILFKRYPGNDTFSFVDDNFMGPGQRGRERGFQLAEEIKRRNLYIRFEITCRADNVQRELFSSLKEAGLYGVYIGIDSGVQRTLNLFRKDIDVQKNFQAAEILNDLGIICDFGFIFFEPSTTIDEVKENLDFLEALRERTDQFIHPTSLLHCLKIYPSTEIHSMYSYLEDVSEDSPKYFQNYDVYLLRKVTKIYWERFLSKRFNEVEDKLQNASLSQTQLSCYREWLESVPWQLISFMRELIEVLRCKEQELLSEDDNIVEELLTFSKNEKLDLECDGMGNRENRLVFHHAYNERVLT